ncbi:MAG: hypothetical protein Q8P47_02840 [Candidatus Beckwithbacteria bacterium]|nr:hypothetical protein [Candidatus Beckwithbacteria bacterium]
MPQPEWHLPSEGRFTPDERNLSPLVRPCFTDSFYVARERGVNSRQLRPQSALAAIPENITKRVAFDLNEVFGFEYWLDPADRRKIAYGVKTGASGIKSFFWGTPISETIGGLGRDEIGLVVLHNRISELKRIPSIDWLKERGFVVLQ